MSRLVEATYVQGSDLADLAVTWLDANGAPVPFSTGWTFELRVGKVGKVAQFVKTAGIIGADTAPNVTVQWATTGELNTLSSGIWDVQIIATRTVDNRHRILDCPGAIRITPLITTPA